MRRDQADRKRRCGCLCLAGGRSQARKYLIESQRSKDGLAEVKGDLKPIRQRDLYATGKDSGQFAEETDALGPENTNALDVIQAIKNDLEAELLANKSAQAHNCIHPRNQCLVAWDLYVTLLLILVCVITPLNLAFDGNAEPTVERTVFETWIDVSFMVDIVIVFNTAYYDDAYKFICDKKVIARGYLTSWFAIDLISCIPLQLLTFTSFNNLFKFARLSKLYRMVKIARLARVLKVLKTGSRIARYIQILSRADFGWDRLLFAIFMFVLLCHIASCSWIMVALYEESQYNDCWLSQGGYSALEGFDLYVAAFYFTITTITTVGYGDIHAYSTIECVVSIIFKITGVLGFSYVTGVISSIIENVDSAEARVEEKMQTLSKIQREHRIPHHLFREIKSAIQFSTIRNDIVTQAFASELPPKLQSLVQLQIHRDVFSTVTFFKTHNYSKLFYAWMGSRLTHMHTSAD